MGWEKGVNMDKKILKVQMFGGFELKYGEENIVLERSSSTKATQLLQYFIYHKGEKIPKKKLLELLYANEDIANPTNNLKVNIFRLRKLLSDSSLPEGEYISFQNGMYYWSSKLPVKIDVFELKELVEKARKTLEDKKLKIKYYEEVLELYKGEFLPMLAAEEWVAVENVQLKEIYLNCINELCSLFYTESKYKDCIRICDKAILLYPYEEQLHLIKIDSFIQMKRFEEAMSVYNKATTMFFEDLGISPSHKMEQLYRQMCDNIDNHILSLFAIQKCLEESGVKNGAYYCNYLAFIDSYRIITRVVERSGQSVCLMLCTLTGIHGETLDDNKLQEATNNLQEAIRNSIRHGDIYTRYNKYQFLVLLLGINQENCMGVSERIASRFSAQSKLRGVRLQYNVTPVTDFNFEETELKSPQEHSHW